MIIDTGSRHDSSYEWKAVTLLALGFGLVGLDRWIVAPLFPAISKDLHLNYQDLGNIIAILGICWGVFSIIMGGLSDRFGRRKILIPAIVAFSLLSGISGLASGLVSLLLIRGVMGLTEGAFCPTSVAAVGEASDPRRRGLNQGLQLSLFALFGLGLGPILATQLLGVLPSWRWVFVIVAIPGLIVAALMYFVIREPAHVMRRSFGARRNWFEMFRYRNVVLAMVGLLCAMCGVFTLSAMVPNYLVDDLHLTPQAMGFVMSAIGIGGFFGEFVVAGLSDVVGRRPVAIVAFAGAAVFVWLFWRSGAAPVALFVLLLVATFFCFGLLSLLTGPIPTEAAPPELASSAVGICSGVGEIFGGGIAPAIAGFVAEHHGIGNIFYVPLTGLIVGVVIACFFQETVVRSGGEKLASFG